MSSNKLLSEEYVKWVSSIKDRIRESQIQAALKVNEELLRLYWELGMAISEKQQQTEWGDRILDQLSGDLRNEFPEIKGFSRSNLFNIRKWYLFYSRHAQLIQQPVGLIEEREASLIVQQPVGQFPATLALIPWGHHIQIITKCHDIEEAVFYLQQTAQHNWSRNILIHQMESQLYQRKGKSLTNFERTLPKAQSDLARELLKNPYNFDFLSLGPEANEREMENALMAQMKNFLLELGSGFAFYGQQYHLKVGDNDFYLDLLFYHTRLHCFIVVELKIGELEPEHIGKLNFYLSAADDLLKGSTDNPTIGLLLCKKADKAIAEYALRDVSKSMGISEYRVLPEEYINELPSIELLEQELKKEIDLPAKPIDQKLAKLKEMISQIKGEELEKEKDNPSIIQLFTETFPAIQERIEKVLAKVISEFRSNKFFRTINHRADFMTLVDLEAMLAKESVHQMSLTIQLNGFIKGGTKAFNVWKELKFELHEHFYYVKTFDGGDRTLTERLYHQSWTDKEIDKLVEELAEIIIDDIRGNIERIQLNN